MDMWKRIEKSLAPASRTRSPRHSMNIVTGYKSKTWADKQVIQAALAALPLINAQEAPELLSQLFVVSPSGIYPLDRL